MTVPLEVATNDEAGPIRRLTAGLVSIETREFIRGALPLFLALGLLNASNYLFHVVASRLLGPAQYGALAALLAFMLVVSVPCGVLQTVVAKRVAVLRARGDEATPTGFIGGTLRSVALLAGLGAVLLAMLTPLIAALVHVGLGPPLLLGPFLFLAMLTSVPLGVLQGRLRFGAVGLTTAVGVLVRLGVGIGLIQAGFGIWGALFGSVFGQAVSLAVAVRLLGLPAGATRSASSTLEALRGEFGPTLAALASFWLLVEADLVLARHYLPQQVSGVYSGVGVIARAILFLPAAISIVALPHFAELRGRTDALRRSLRISLGMTGALAFSAFGALWLLRVPVLDVTYGAEYATGSGFLPIVGLAMMFLALVNVLVYFHVAVDSKAHRLILVGVGLEVVLVALFHRTPQEIALVVLGVCALVAAAEYHAGGAVLRWRPSGAAVAFGVVEEGGPAPELSVVLPCYNAGASLGEVLERLLRAGEGGSREIIVVSDGSTDETVQVARGFPSDSVRVLSYAEHAGKGQALRVGLTAARGSYVAFLDADGDIDPAALEPLLAIVRLYEPEIVLGSKRHPLSQVHYPPLRRLLSWTYHKLARVLFHVKVRDTQTGLKLIRRDVLEAVLPRMLEKRYAFDLELLVVARALGYSRVFEAPVRIDYRFSSQVDLRAAVCILLDTLAIFYRRYVLDTYRRDPGSTSRGAAKPASTGVLRIPDRGTSDGHLRVLFLNWRDITNPEAGGAEIFTHEVAKRWVEQGHEVSLLTSRFSGGSQVETVDGVRIRRIGRLRNGSFHLLVQRELARLSGFDLVIDEVNTIPFFTPLWRRRLPPVVTLIHQLAVDVWDSEMPRPLAALGRRVEPRLLGLYEDVPVLTVSESTRDDLCRLGLRNVRVIPIGRDEPPDLNGVEKEDVPTFLFVGRLTRNKRPDHAVEAFRHIRERLPEAHLWIVGRGPMEESLREQLPPGAEMLGYLSRRDLYERMARAHCLLVTSVREGWGMVITEANSVGTPAVGYDVPGVRDAIRNGETGLLAKVAEPVELARAALSLVAHRGEYASSREQALAASRLFSWQRTADAFLALATHDTRPLAKLAPVESRAP